MVVLLHCPVVLGILDIMDCVEDCPRCQVGGIHIQGHGGQTGVDGFGLLVEQEIG